MLKKNCLACDKSCRKRDRDCFSHVSGVDDGDGNCFDVNSCEASALGGMGIQIKMIEFVETFPKRSIYCDRFNNIIIIMGHCAFSQTTDFDKITYFEIDIFYMDHTGKNIIMR